MRVPWYIHGNWKLDSAQLTDLENTIPKIVSPDKDDLYTTYHLSYAEKAPKELSFLNNFYAERVAEIAKELGIELSINYSTLDSNYSNLISARVVAKNDIIFEGSVFNDDLPRLVNLMGYKMEVYLKGTLLFIQNDDVPGVVGKVGTILGKNKINIQVISTSEIKISVLIDKKDIKKALIALHKEFKLEN